MGRVGGKETKENIIFQAFILFSKKPYDKVTFRDIEEATGLSRGAVLYHFSSKQEIFEKVVETSLLSRTVFLELPIKETEPLKNFICDFIESCKTTIKKMEKHGLNNINLAHYNIEAEALYFYPQFDKLSRQMRTTEVAVWTNVIKKAQEAEEIKKCLNPELLGTVFLNTYYGHALAASKNENGCNVSLLMNELMLVREMSM